jgi:predicted nucleotidyltransferase
MLVNGDYIISTLRKDKTILQKKSGVNALGLFGSYAKNNQNDEIDIDLLPEQEEVDYIKLIRTLNFIQQKFTGEKVQLTRKGHIFLKNFFPAYKEI